MAQEFQVLEKQELPATKFWGVDNFGAKYYNQHLELIKKADQTYSYSNKSFGTPDFVDLSNPMRILVFYKAVQQAVVLDNKLNPIQIIDFNTFDDLGFVSHIGTASGQSLWVFDESQNEVYLYHPNTKEIISLLQTRLKADLIRFVGLYNYAFVQTEDELYLYSHNGSFISSKQLKADLYLASKGVLVHSDNDLYYWRSNKTEMQKLEIDLKNKDFKNLFYSQEKLYLFDGKFLHTYIAEK